MAGELQLVSPGVAWQLAYEGDAEKIRTIVMTGRRSGSDEPPILEFGDVLLERSNRRGCAALRHASAVSRRALCQPETVSSAFQLPVVGVRQLAGEQPHCTKIAADNSASALCEVRSECSLDIFASEQGSARARKSDSGRAPTPRRAQMLPSSARPWLRSSSDHRSFTPSAARMENREREGCQAYTGRQHLSLAFGGAEGDTGCQASVAHLVLHAGWPARIRSSHDGRLWSAGVTFSTRRMPGWPARVEPYP